MRDTDAFSLGVDIARALDAAGLPNALGGAIALAAWGVPRATVDVDINAFVDDEDLDRVFDVLEALGIEIELLGVEVSVLSAEALAIFKLLFFRGKDVVDLERLVATQRDRMDLAYVRRWMVDMMGDDDERVAKWDELCRLHG